MNSEDKKYTWLEKLVGLPSADQRAENSAVDTRAARSNYERWKYNHYLQGNEVRLPDNPLTAKSIQKRPVFAPGYSNADTPAYKTWIDVPVKAQNIQPISESFNAMPNNNTKTASYSDFKKEAGIGDVASWAGNKLKDSFGIWSPIPMGNPLKADSYRVFTPFADKTNAFSSGPTANSVYGSAQSADQKFDAFQRDVRNQANNNIGVLDAAGAVKDDLQRYGINLNPFSVRDNWNTMKKTWNTITGKDNGPSAMAQLKDKAFASDDMKAAADRFIQSSDIGDIATYQKRVEEMASKMPNSEAAKQFKSYIADGMKSRVWDGIKQDPVKNIPAAAGIFLRQMGLGKAGDFMSNPIAFYGSILGLIGGGLLLGSRR